MFEEAPDVDACRQLEASAAACYFDAWCGHPATTMRFAKGAKVPSHWPVFDHRRSLLTKAMSNRKAERPLNAVLNLAYHFALIEARQAAVALGLHPGIGFVHSDQPGKDALAFDLVEPVRPMVERFILDLVAERTFVRADFVEHSDGSVRIAPKLVQELAATMPMWAKEVAPHAEAAAHLLGQAVAGKWQPHTPLTGRRARAAQAKVKAAKADQMRRRQAASVQAQERLRRADPAQAALGFASCVDCGRPLERTRHVRCGACWKSTPAQSRAARRKRGQAIAASRAELDAWKQANPDARGDPAYFRESILPKLQTVRLGEIMAACDVSKSTASGFRSGRHTPALRHWDALAALGSPTRSQT